MTLAPGSHTFGPKLGGGHLTVKTRRSSLAAVAAHDLTLEVTEWEGTLEIGEDEAQTRIELKADGGSLRVSDDEKGVTTRTDLDKESVHENIASEVLKGTSITFRSTSTSTEESEEGRRLRVQGELELGGQTAQVDFELEIGEDEEDEDEDGKDDGKDEDEGGKDEDEDDKDEKDDGEHKDDNGKADHEESGDAKGEHDDDKGDDDKGDADDDDEPEQDQNDRPISGSAVVKQSDFGIEPYSSLLGAISVADEVVVEFEGKLSP